jgi:RHS repeat-associated protein
VDGLLALQSGTTTTYQHKDALDTVTSLSGSTGALANSYVFDSLGASTASTGGGANVLRFADEELDKETGLYHVRSRYYSPQLGRFISEDPLGFRGGDVDFYAYVGNDPIDYVDPFGLGQQRSPRRGPPNTDVYIPDPNVPDGGTIRVYGPTGEAVHDYDFGHDHGAGDPHGHDWGVDNNGKPTRGPGRPLKPTECTRVRDDYWKNFWNAFYQSYFDHMVRVWENTQNDFDDFTHGLAHPVPPNPATVPFAPGQVPPYVYVTP